MNIFTRKKNIQNVINKVRQILKIVEHKYVGKPANETTFHMLQQDLHYLLQEAHELTEECKEQLTQDILKNMFRVPRHYQKW